MEVGVGSHPGWSCVHDLRGVLPYPTKTSGLAGRQGAARFGRNPWSANRFKANAGFCGRRAHGALVCHWKTLLGFPGVLLRPLGTHPLWHTMSSKRLRSHLATATRGQPPGLWGSGQGHTRKGASLMPGCGPGKETRRRCAKGDRPRAPKEALDNVAWGTCGQDRYPILPCSTGILRRGASRDRCRLSTATQPTAWANSANLPCLYGSEARP